MTTILFGLCAALLIPPGQSANMNLHFHLNGSAKAQDDPVQGLDYQEGKFCEVFNT